MITLFVVPATIHSFSVSIGYLFPPLRRAAILVIAAIPVLIARIVATAE
jgi:hypothetical protein